MLQHSLLSTPRRRAGLAWKKFVTGTVHTLATIAIISMATAFYQRRLPKTVTTSFVNRSVSACGLASQPFADIICEPAFFLTS